MGKGVLFMIPVSLIQFTIICENEMVECSIQSDLRTKGVGLTHTIVTCIFHFPNCCDITCLLTYLLT